MELRRGSVQGISFRWMWPANAGGRAVIASDRGRAQHLAPMLNPIFQRAFASVSQFFEIDLFEDPEGETFGPMNVPGGLKRLVHLNALPERERAAGPDRGKIGR